MRRVMVRYKVKADRAAENETFIRGVFEELAGAAPAGVRYRSVKLEDGVTFVHVFEAEAEDYTLGALSAFKAFTADIRERCEDPPVTTAFEAIGAYPAALA